MGMGQVKKLGFGRIQPILLADTQHLLGTHPGASVKDNVGPAGVKQIDVAIKWVGHIKAKLSAPN